MRFCRQHGPGAVKELQSLPDLGGKWLLGIVAVMQMEFDFAQPAKCEIAQDLDAWKVRILRAVEPAVLRAASVRVAELAGKLA